MTTNENDKLDAGFARIASIVIATMIATAILFYFTLYDRMHELENQVNQVNSSLKNQVTQVQSNLTNKTDALEKNIDRVEDLVLYPPFIRHNTNQNGEPNNSQNSGPTEETITYIYHEEFDGSASEWILPGATFWNGLDSGHYVISDNTDGGFVYSAIELPSSDFQRSDYAVELKVEWESGVKNKRFGLLLMKDWKNLMRFEATKNGDASAYLKDNKLVGDQVIPHQLVSSNNASADFEIKVMKIGNTYEYVLNGNRIGSFKESQFDYHKIGVFMEGKQAVGFDELSIRALSE